MPQSVNCDSTRNVNLVEYLHLLTAKIRLIVACTVISALVAAGISLMLPNMYEGTVKLFPEESGGSLAGGIMAQMGALATLGGDLLGQGSSADLYMDILRSDTVREGVVHRFDLMKVYGAKLRQEARAELEKNTRISLNKKSNVITITVTDRSPERAAAIANGYTVELTRVVTRLNVDGVSQQKGVLQERLTKARADLARAEAAMTAFQGANRMIDLPAQAKATIESTATFRAQLAAEEVQLGVLRRQFTDASTEVRSAQEKITALRRQLSKIEGSEGGAIPAIGSVPRTGEQQIRLMREFKMQEALVEALSKQVEVAGIAEAGGSQRVQVIQEASVPEKRVRPARAAITLGGAAAGFAGSVIVALLMIRYSNLPDEEKMRLRAVATAALDSLHIRKDRR